MKQILLLCIMYMVMYNNHVLSAPYAIRLSYDCCYTFVNRLPHISKLNGYIKTSSFCTKGNGVIFITKRLKTFCYKLNKQSKSYIEKLDKSYIYEDFNENKSISVVK
ncbi:protein K6 [BeAn 58058 virus]|uniref:protein K6 n=1 Tax=BeAn 58058 virus TaxID=67082 RepID=UPI0009097C7C|nr:protein K6 [BeAn 58058 virus]APG58200.1 protein K6 [BeAn 58058 virus]